MNLKYRLVPRGLSPPTKHLEFDFIVAERPQYIPGSGPPLAPVTIMPPHDKDGYIIEQVMLYSEWRYIVGFHDIPNLRVGVRLPNILRWVSARELEKWNTNKYDAEVQEEEERELPLLEAKEERKNKRLEKLAKIGLSGETKSRKRKRTPVEEAPLKLKKAVTYTLGKKSHGRPRGPGSRNQPVEAEITFKSPKQSQHSQQQQSLSAPGGGLANRTVLDTDSEDEVTEIALQYQLLGRRIPQSNMQSSRSNSPPPTNSKPTSRSRSTSIPADTSRQESESPSVSAPRQKRPAILPPHKGTVAAISSREALKVYEKLERTSKKKEIQPIAHFDQDGLQEERKQVRKETRRPSNNEQPQTLSDKYSYTKNKPRPRMFQGAHSCLPPPTRGVTQVGIEEEETDEPIEEDQVTEEDTEPEYEMKQILKHDVRRTDDGKPDIWYLIDWVGEWDNTWEPAENVDQGAIDEYEAKRKKKKRFRGGATWDGNDSDSDSLFVSEGIAGGKGKQIQRVNPGQVIDVDEDDDSEHEPQWQGFGGGV